MVIKLDRRKVSTPAAHSYKLAPNVGHFLGLELLKFPLSILSTRGRKKATGISKVPTNQSTEPMTSTVTIPAEPLGRKQTRSRTKVPATRKSKVVVTPVKR